MKKNKRAVELQNIYSDATKVSEDKQYEFITAVGVMFGLTVTEEQLKNVKKLYEEYIENGKTKVAKTGK